MERTRESERDHWTDQGQKSGTKETGWNTQERAVNPTKLQFIYINLRFLRELAFMAFPMTF